MNHLVLLVIGCIVSPFMLIQASAVDGDRTILDLRVLNQIMGGINQLNHHFRQAVELLKQIAEMHQSAPLPDLMHGAPMKNKRPSYMTDSFMEEISNNPGRRSLNLDKLDNNNSAHDNDDGGSGNSNSNSNTNINMNTNANTHGYKFRNLMHRRVPFGFI